jgi:hypothetical protein
VITPTLPREIYSPAVLSRAIKDYQAICDVHVINSTTLTITLRISAKAGNISSDAPDFGEEFLNYVLDLAALDAGALS